jgi:competence protein ComEA
MFKKILGAALGLAVAAYAWAAVDVNTASDDALRGVRGVGPAKARAIIDERNEHGPFKDAADLARRVKGMGGSTVERLQAEGLTIGAAKPVASPPPAKAAGAPARK